MVIECGMSLGKRAKPWARQSPLAKDDSLGEIPSALSCQQAALPEIEDLNPEKKGGMHIMSYGFHLHQQMIKRNADEIILLHSALHLKNAL